MKWRFLFNFRFHLWILANKIPWTTLSVLQTFFRKWSHCIIIFSCWITFYLSGPTRYVWAPSEEQLTVGESSLWRIWSNLHSIELKGFKNEHNVWYPFISHGPFGPLYLYLLWISVSLVWPSIIRFSLSLTITILLSIAATRSDNWKKLLVLL